jgi:hypothetical protein
LSYNDDLSAASYRLSGALKVAKHLAGVVDEIRTSKPRGYGSPASYDGAARPVEDVVVALDDRGVSDQVIRARKLLNQAAELTERAAHHLDGAVTAWEGKV